MSEANVAQPAATPAQASGNAKIIYILYLANILVPLVGLVGLIMAYIYKGDAPEWEKKHYQFQIRTFWIGLLYLFIGMLTAMVVVGYFVLLFWLVWHIVRCVKGLQSFGRSEAPANPTSWMFG